jgi:transposase
VLFAIPTFPSRQSPGAISYVIAAIAIDIGKNSFHVVGHDARGAIVLPAKYVRPYSKQKNDFRDAEAIAEAVQRPHANAGDPNSPIEVCPVTSTHPR